MKPGPFQEKDSIYKYLLLIAYLSGLQPQKII